MDLLTTALRMSTARARVELGLDRPEDWAARPVALGTEAARFRYRRPEDGERTLDIVRLEAPTDHPLAGTKDGKTYRPARFSGREGGNVAPGNILEHPGTRELQCATWHIRGSSVGSSGGGRVWRGGDEWATILMCVRCVLAASRVVAGLECHVAKGSART